MGLTKPARVALRQTYNDPGQIHVTWRLWSATDVVFMLAIPKSGDTQAIHSCDPEAL